MKITIFGATGATGQELIRQGLQKGYHISTIIRSKLTIIHPNLTVIRGDIFDKKTVVSVIESSDLVISVLAFTPKLFGKNQLTYTQKWLLFLWKQ